jgi:DNA-binding LytR/AlgR family response regulator
MKIISSDQIYFFRDNEIIRFESVAGTTLVHLQNGTTASISATINEIEEQLASKDFIRTGEQHLVNLNHITSISKSTEDFIVLDNGIRLPIAPGRKQTIITLLNSHLNNLKP